MPTPDHPAANAPPDTAPPDDVVSVSVSDPHDTADRLEVQARRIPDARLPERVARAAIERKAFELACAGTPLGDPRSPLEPVESTQAWQQLFDNAWIVTHPGSAAVALRRGGAIATQYSMLGGPAGDLGCPVTDEHAVGNGAICLFDAPGSAITWHPHLGAHVVHGPIGEYWLDSGGPEGPWGFPVSDEYAPGKDVLAVDFEAGTMLWRGDAGIALLPTETDLHAGSWLALLREPPRRGRRMDTAPGAADDSTTLSVPGRSRDAAHLAATSRVDRSRSLLTVSDRDGTDHPAEMHTTVTPAEVLQRNDTPLPAGLTAEDLYRAELELWRTLWSGGTPPVPVRAFGSPTLTWAGFAADGDLERLVRTLFDRSPEARRLFLQVGLSVAEMGQRWTFVAANTERGWRVYGAQAERYIRANARLLSFLDAVAAGTVPAALLDEADLPPTANETLRQATLDAQFLTVVAGAGRLPGWTLQEPWTPALRAAVTHNIHAGCLTGWDVYEHTGGVPHDVVRAMAWDFFCGPGALIAQSRARFEGPLSHGVLGDAASWFPATQPDDDGHGVYLVAGGRRRRIERPLFPPFTAIGEEAAAPSPARPPTP